MGGFGSNQASPLAKGKHQLITVIPFLMTEKYHKQQQAGGKIPYFQTYDVCLSLSPPKTSHWEFQGVLYAGNMFRAVLAAYPESKIIVQARDSTVREAGLERYSRDQSQKEVGLEGTPRRSRS